LKINILDEYSPGIVKKIVYSATHSSSFPQAERDLAALVEIEVGAKQVERMAHRIGGDLIKQSAQAIESYQALPLVKKELSPLAHPPTLAVIQMDGGRYQRRADAQGEDPADELSMEEEPEEDEKTSHWREDKIGLLMTMKSEIHDADPCPEIPAFFVRRAAVEKLVTQVGHIALGTKSVPDANASSQAESDVATSDSNQPGNESASDYEAPTLLVRTMVATAQPIASFVKQLAQAAWARGFAKARRKAFVADGASANWSTWKKLFSDYVPILDFIHALSYVYLAATAIHRDPEAIWAAYCRWIALIWNGDVTDVIDELRQHQQVIGVPEADEAKTSPRKRLAKALGYIDNHQSKMRYHEYRKQGLPMTSCHVESTVKLFNKRVKGTEKFWSSQGAEAMLRLKAAYLSETGQMDAYWESRYSAPSSTAASALAA
jgi:hypothetical protein